MQKRNDTQDFHFFVRASHNVVIQLYQSPGALFPCFTVNRKSFYLTYLSLKYREMSHRT